MNMFIIEKNNEQNNINSDNINNNINIKINELTNNLTNESINDLTNESINDLTNESINDLTNESINDLTNEYKIGIQKKKKLLEITKNLSLLEYNEIFNILQEDNCQYSDNNNGIFINLQNISDKTIDTIFTFLNFIKKKKEELHIQDSFLENIKKDIEIKNENVINNYNSNSNYNNNNNNNNNNEEYFYSITDDLENDKNNFDVDEYLCFSSDEDIDLDNKLSLKKKKTKYTGKKAKLIKSIKDPI